MSYIGTAPTIGNFQVCDAISVVNGQASYTMQVGGVNATPQSANHMLVSLNGILQKPNSSFTVSGSVITFASNLVTGDVIDFIQILGDVLDLGVPSDNTVSLAKLTATGTKDATTFLRGDNTFASAGGTNTPAFYVNKNDSQSLSANTTTKIQFDDEVFDTASAYDNSTNYRFTVPSGQAGKYFIHGCLRIDSAVDTDDFNIYIYKNGSEIGRKNISHFNYESNSISQLLELSENDYIENYASLTATVGTEAGATVNFFYGYKIIE